MKVNSISQDNFQNKNIKRNNIIKNAATIAGAIVLSSSLYIGADYFSGRKKHQKSIARLDKSRQEELETKVRKEIELRTGHNEVITDEDIEIMRDLEGRLLNSKYFQQKEALKKARKLGLQKGMIIATALGIIVGGAFTVYKNITGRKKKDESTDIETETPNIPSSNPDYKNQTTYFSYQFNKNNLPKVYSDISFTGIQEDLAGVKSMKDYLNKELNKKYTNEELKTAKKISKLTVIKDWPNHLAPLHRIYYTNEAINPETNEPLSDREYQMLVIKKICGYPRKPDSKFRTIGFTYKQELAVRQWGEYISASIKKERLEKLVNKMRYQQYVLKKQKLAREAENQIREMCIKKRIADEFIQNLNSADKKFITAPNSVMILGSNKKTNIKYLNWIIGESNTNFLFIKDNPQDSNETKLNQITTALEELKEKNETNGLKGMLYVENFTKLLEDTPQNEEIIGYLKDLLDKVSEQYNTTILFETKGTVGLNPIALQNHRVKRYDTERKITTKELQQAQIDYIKSNLYPLDEGGYKFRYIPFTEKFTQLYQGNFGYNKKVLWVNSTDPSAIKSVIDNFSIIRTVPDFWEATKIQFPEPDYLSSIPQENLTRTSYYTKDYKRIYEYDFD